jgi:hypothetical protein
MISISPLQQKARFQVNKIMGSQNNQNQTAHHSIPHQKIKDNCKIKQHLKIIQQVTSHL